MPQLQFVSENDTLVNGWQSPGCHFVQNVFLCSVLLVIGTFSITVGLKNFRSSNFFPSWVRSLVSDFAVIIAMVSMTGIDIWLDVQTPKLKVPANFTPTIERAWLVHPLGNNPWWSALFAFFPALLATILVFMDQQITVVIVNRKENLLKVRTTIMQSAT